MKKIAIIYIMVQLSLTICSQNSIPVNVFIQESNLSTNKCKEYLLDKITNILAENGILCNNYSDRFYMTAKVYIVEKKVVKSVSPQILQKIEIVYNLGDAIDNIIYSTFSRVYIGIGNTEESSQLNALSKIKSDDSYSRILRTSQEKIIGYYSQRCNSIIKEADLCSLNKEFDKAIYMLSLIPSGVECYEEVLACMKIIYSNKLDYDNQILLSRAKQAWSSNPNQNGAKEAITFIAQIKPNDIINKEVDVLLTLINEKLQADERKEWELMFKQYEGELALKMQENQSDADLLNTCIQLGFEYLTKNFQPINIIENLLLW